MNMPETAPSGIASQLKLDAHWMPYTANRNFQRDPRLIVAADGNYLVDDKGRRIFDALSGLWTCGAGHTRKEISEAVARQVGVLDYSPAFQYGHPLSFQLAEKITQLTPGDLNHVFFTNSGSECADTALKMVRAYWRLKGQATKTKMIGRARGYHGVNIAGTSLGGVNGNRKMFGQLLDVDHLPHTVLPVNAPKATKADNYGRDGVMALRNGSRHDKNYEPNSYQGPAQTDAALSAPLAIHGWTGTHAAPAHTKDDDFFQAGELYRLMSDGEKARLIANLAGFLAQVSREDIVEKNLAHFHAADEEYGSRLEAAVKKLRAGDDA